MTTTTDTAFDTAGIDMLLGQVTYWRIDGSNDGVMWPGDLWQFTTRTYSSVDDFESYTTDSLAEAGQVFEVWFDGYGGFNNSGSTVDFVRTDQKYDGKQSMGLLFNNTGQNYIFQPEKTYSEVYCEVPNPDWIGGGAQALFLAWRGDTYTQPGIDEGRQIPLTESDTLYVVVKDTAGKQAVVPWTGTVADLEAPLWHEWYIGFSDLAGINLSSIDKLYIGIGNRTTPALGGRGMIWVDTIRLTTLE
jgi:hypothetical protein